MVRAYLDAVDETGGASRGFDHMMRVMERTASLRDIDTANIATTLTDETCVGKLRMLARRDPTSSRAKAAVKAIFGERA